MKYGHFDDVHQEYVITTPKTPLPWINYLGCNEFFSLISNTCGGYTFYKDAKLLRLTRYRYNNVPADINGKYLYIKDGDTVWNPGWQPTKTELDSYECRHGIGYSRFTSSKNGVKASVLSFVPLNDNCEISQLTLTNGSSEDKKLSVFSYVEWCLWNADDDMKNFQRNLSTGEVEVQDSTIYHKTEYRERRNHYAIYSVNTKIDGFDTSRDAFLGAYRGADSPEAVENGKCTNSMASGWSPIASHQINVDLAAGETKTFIFVLGYIENPEDEKWESYGVINKTRAKEMLAKYQTDAQVEDAFAALQAYWKQLLARYTVASADDKVNRMVNTWNQYQCMVTFNMSRSASYYESGIGRGMGFRDSCQDLLGFVHLIPDRARERIIDIASTQFQDGSAYHQHVGYQLGADRHAGTVLAVLTRPAEVGHHGHDLMGRGAARGVDHHQQFHQVVRGREGRLDDKDRTAADRLVVAGLEFAVAEAQDFRLSERRAEARGDLFGQILRIATGENFDFVDSHRFRGFF